MDKIEVRLKQIPNLVKLIREDGEETTRFTAVVEKDIMFLITFTKKELEGLKPNDCIVTYVSGDRNIEFQDLFSLDNIIEVIERVTTLKGSVTYSIRKVNPQDPAI